MPTRDFDVRLKKDDEGVFRPDLKGVEGVSGWIEDTGLRGHATYHVEASAAKLRELEDALRGQPDDDDDDDDTPSARSTMGGRGEAGRATAEGPTPVQTQRNPAAASPTGMTPQDVNRNPTEANAGAATREQQAFARGENEDQAGRGPTTERGGRSR